MFMINVSKYTSPMDSMGKEGITPTFRHSYSFGIGLEPEKSYSIGRGLES